MFVEDEDEYTTEEIVDIVHIYVVTNLNSAIALFVERMKE